MIKDINSSEAKFNVNQLGHIAEKFIDALVGHTLYRRLGATTQALFTEAIIFTYKYSPFTFKLETEVEQDDITKQKTVKETYIFDLKLKMPCGDNSIDLKTFIRKVDLDSIV